MSNVSHHPGTHKKGHLTSECSQEFCGRDPYDDQLVTVCITVKVEDVYEYQLQQLEVCARGVFEVSEVRCGTYSEDEIYYPAKED